MRPITDKIVKELRSRNISLDSYVNDEIVKALLDNDFSHDYILKSIDEGDIKLDKKPEDIEKEDVEEEGVKKCDNVKKCDKVKKSDIPEEEEEEEEEEEDVEKGEEKYEKIKKADNEEEEEDDEDIEARVEKSIRRTLRKSFGAQLSELNGLVKSLQDEISTLKNERTPFRTVNSSAIIEKSMNLGKDNDGKNILSKAMNRIQIGKELTKAFEEEQDSEIKKSLGSDILGFSVSGGDLSKDSVEVLEKRGYKIVD